MDFTNLFGNSILQKAALKALKSGLVKGNIRHVFMTFTPEKEEEQQLSFETFDAPHVMVPVAELEEYKRVYNQYLLGYDPSNDNREVQPGS